MKKRTPEATKPTVSREDQLHLLSLVLVWSFLKFSTLVTNPNPSPKNLIILVLPGEQKEFIFTHLQTTFYIAKDLWFFSFLAFQRSDVPPFFSRQDTQASHGGQYGTVSLCHLTQHLHTTFASQSRWDMLKSLLKSLLSPASPLATVLQSHWADLIQLVPAWAVWVFIYRGASTLFSRPGIFLGNLRKTE